MGEAFGSKLTNFQKKLPRGGSIWLEAYKLRKNSPEGGAFGSNLTNFQKKLPGGGSIWLEAYKFSKKTPQRGRHLARSLEIFKKNSPEGEAFGSKLTN